MSLQVSVCTGGLTVVITSTQSSLIPVGSVHLKVAVLVPEEDVMTEVDAAFTLVIAAAGIINDIATVAINNNFTFLVVNLLNWTNLAILTNKSEDRLAACMRAISSQAKLPLL